MTTNLDMECAKLGAKLATQSDEKTLTDALSVLEEQGVYAFFLYLEQKKDRRKVTNACRQFLSELLPEGFAAADDAFEVTQELARDIDRLLLARDLLRQSLIYGRYHAKARGSSGGAA